MKKFTHSFIGNAVKTRQNLGISFILTCLHFARWFSSYCQRSIKLNGTTKPISIEYKMVHGLNRAVFRT